MYPNLMAEMARIEISVSDLSRVTRRTDRCIRNKVTGKGDFTLTEIVIIRNSFFPGQSLDYLFARKDSA